MGEIDDVEAARSAEQSKLDVVLLDSLDVLAIAAGVLDAYSGGVQAACIPSGQMCQLQDLWSRLSQ